MMEKVIQIIPFMRYHKFILSYYLMNLGKPFTHKKISIQISLKMHWLCYVFLIFLACSVQAQHFPPISKFEPTEYDAGNQNWMIDQCKDGTIVVANNEGLLLYNGAQWRNLGSDNGSLIRSAKVIDEKIYIGSYMDFGYWEKQNTGAYQYTSLKDKVEVKAANDEQFWNILQDGKNILFQSLKAIYIYDTQRDKVKIITPQNGVSKMFKLGESIVYQSQGIGLFKIQNGESIDYPTNQEIVNDLVINIFSTEEGVKILTKNNGFYLYQNASFNKWTQAEEAIYPSEDIFSAIQLENGDLAIGTISKGLLILDKQGQTKLQIDQSKGMSNNTVLSLNEDDSNNIWLALDNGINCVNIASPFMEYLDKQGILGTVYAAKSFQGKLYIGTNQGLFAKSIEDQSDFKMLSNTNGQVWGLYELDNQLFCGHDKGTLQIKNDKAELIAKKLGTWRVSSIANQPNQLLQGNYDGLNMLVKEGGNWQFSHSIEGFSGSAQQFYYLNNKVYLNHHYKGLSILNLDPEFKKVVNESAINSDMTIANAGLVLFDNQLYFACKQGMFILNTNNDQLEQENQLSDYLIKNEHQALKLISEDQRSMWLFTNKGILHFAKGNNDEIQIREFLIDLKLLTIMNGFENITSLGDDIFLIGLTSGYFCIDLKRYESLNKDYSIAINAIQLNMGQQDSILNINEAANLEHTQNNISFSYNVPQTYKFQAIQYRYWLEGYQKDWTKWGEKPQTSFQNLQNGDYQFKVQAKIGDQITENTATYSFNINKPWYLSGLAILCYLLLLIALAFLINQYYKRYYSRQQQKLLEQKQKELEYVQLKSEQELIQIKNKQLTAEIEAKNKELAANTMNVIKKNEFLISIRESLKNISDKNSTQAIDSINSELENEETWELLKNAFENVDKDFLKKIKEKHPELTPNDLKLCTYLRLNLTSKEIAPLLNISVRSMETKRYRLRKKMELPRDTNLVEYILSV